MFLNFNQLYINFDNIVDTESLVAMRPRLSAAIAKNSHLINPSKYFYTNFYDTSLNNGILNYEQEFEKDIQDVVDPVLKEELIELNKKDKYGYYCQYEKEASGGNFSLVLRYSAKTYYDKQFKDCCKRVAEDVDFDFFYQWLDTQQIFSDYGRVTVFINHIGIAAALHKDWPFSDDRNEDQFIWINLFGDKKKFYMYDPDKDEKIYVDGICNWFNTGNWHGTDRVEHACYTIRVDGVFADEFLAKINKVN